MAEENISISSLQDPQVAAVSARKRERVREWLGRKGLDGVVISRRDNFAWLTTGGDNKVLRNSELGVGHLVITRDRQYLVAHYMDSARMVEEQAPARIRGSPSCQYIVIGS